MMYAFFLSDKKYRKLESRQLSKLHSGQKLTDSADIFSLPQYIRVVVVSNYQPLQTIFAIPKGERPTQQIKADEQFSPIVTIVDTATQQPLDCVLLLLHGEKPPEVNCRTLFCYIAVQVTVDPYYADTHDSQLYQVKSKPCKQSKLPLIFCFHQPGTVCVIQLSVHSIVDSEGVEYMYNSENCDCIVRIIDKNPHELVKTTGRHGVVRMKEPPLLRYTGPLTGERFHKLERQFTKMFLSPGYEQIQQLSKKLVESRVSSDIKVFALCWEALSVGYNEKYERAEELLRTAWEKASPIECENGLLLQAKILKQLAFMRSFQGNDDKALEYISGAKERLFIAAPSNETAQALHTELRLKRRRLFSRPNFTISSELYKSTEEEYEQLLEHAKHMEEYENPAICSFLTVKATFHLRSDLITDKLPPKEYWPSPDDLRKAEECLSGVPLDTMPDQSNFYTAKYYRAFCDLHIWKKQYSEAMRYVKEARKLYDQIKLEKNIALQQVDQRLKLQETLIGEEKIDEILKEYSNTDIV